MLAVFISITDYFNIQFNSDCQAFLKFSKILFPFFKFKYLGGGSRERRRRSFRSSSREGKLRLSSWYDYVEFDKREEG